MNELSIWLVWAAACVAANVLDPAAWVVLLLALFFTNTRTGLIATAAATVAIIVGCLWLTSVDQRAIGNDSIAPMLYVLHVGKLFVFALGVALNRVVLRIEKRFTGVLEKART